MGEGTDLRGDELNGEIAPGRAYAGAVAVALIAVLLRWSVDGLVDGVQFITFFPAVMLVAYSLGTRPGLLTAGLCGVAGWYLFVEPAYSFRIERLGDAISLLAYFGVSGFMAIGLGMLRGARRREAAALRSLTESEVRFRVAADSSPALMWMSDEKAEIIFANQRYRDFFGVETDAMLGQGWRSIVHPDDVDGFHAAFLNLFERRQPVSLDVRVTHPSEGVRWLRCNGQPRFEAGLFRGYVGVNIDVTEARLTHAAVEEQAAQLGAVLEQMPIGVIVARVPDGEILVYNSSAERLMGHSVLGKKADEYGHYGAIHPDGSPFEPAEYPMSRALTGEAVEEEELRYRRGDGELVFLSVSATPVKGTSSTPDLAVCAFTDISERRALEHHHRLLINELNHRVKNSLAILQAIAQQTFKPGVPFEQARRSFEGRITALSNAHNVLTAEQWDAAPLRNIVEGSVVALRSSAGQVTMSGPDVKLPPKFAVSLAMAIHELATNAVKYGSLSVPDGTVSVQWSVRGSELELVWREHGGPTVVAPAKKGFGSRLLERGLASELKGTVRVQYEEMGLICIVNARLSET